MIKKQIKSFRDLEVFRNTYKVMLIVHQEILPKLPSSERFDLKDQLSRSTKAIPRLIAEGYGKRHQKAGFQKYLDDCIGECNETVVSLEQCKDIYKINGKYMDEVLSIYEISARQIYRLREAWTNLKTQPPNPYTKLAS